MKTLTAVSKLEKAGFTVISNGTFYSAKKDDVIVDFTTSNDQVRTNGFSYFSSTSCAPTFGLKLKQVI